MSKGYDELVDNAGVLPIEFVTPTAAATTLPTRG
jgi:hypothetical protein